ncbi:hypothetical protein T484DRAFT_1963530 [Baffinella frigidus]|nr:hypothetical protein T484DRAFT_1963530 [Cryptophyta sp. CCMP2293]
MPTSLVVPQTKPLGAQRHTAVCARRDTPLCVRAETHRCVCAPRRVRVTRCSCSPRSETLRTEVRHPTHPPTHRGRVRAHREQTPYSSRPNPASLS